MNGAIRIKYFFLFFALNPNQEPREKNSNRHSQETAKSTSIRTLETHEGFRHQTKASYSNQQAGIHSNLASKNKLYRSEKGSVVATHKPFITCVQD